MFRSHVYTLVSAMAQLVLPEACAACEKAPPAGDQALCLQCIADMAETQFHKVRGNPFEMHFWGRVPIMAGSAFLFFIQGGRTQHLIHQIKYKGKKHLAFRIGERYGSLLNRDMCFQDVDLIVPVPLHWKKARRRGFNQSAYFARGLSESLGIPWSKSVLRRTRFTETQTRKTREQRVKNLENAFEVPDPDRIRGMHVLLVDDVLTTGATLEACARQLLKYPGVQISMLTLATGKL